MSSKLGNMYMHVQSVGKGSNLNVIVLRFGSTTQEHIFTTK